MVTESKEQMSKGSQTISCGQVRYLFEREALSWQGLFDRGAALRG